MFIHFNPEILLLGMREMLIWMCQNACSLEYSQLHTLFWTKAGNNSSVHSQ